MRIRRLYRTVNTKLRLLLISVTMISVVFLASCQATETSSPPAIEKQIVVATGSPFELGLIDELASAFKQETGCTVRCVKTPTGPGLDLGRHGMVHITMGHDPLATAQFCEDGYATKHILLMHNYTVIVGPASDPAEIRGLEDLKEAHSRIFESKSEYLSRGDRGGMNLLELRIWEELGKDPSAESWYHISGKFMLDSLLEADSNGEYHMLDSSTWTIYKSQMENIELLVQGPANNYEMCLVSMQRYPNLSYNQDFAEQFYDYLTGSKGQNIIATFGISEYGEPLYYPDVIPEASP
jgi:tungstate transport system substrate-binding protein